MSRKTGIVTSQLAFENNVAPLPSNLIARLALPGGMDIFRIQIQCDLPSHVIEESNLNPIPGYAVPLIPYLKISNSNSLNAPGMHLYVKPFVGIQDYGNFMCTASDILVLDRRNTSPAFDSIYLSAHNLPTGVPVNVLVANILFEGYL